jgi:hypothetical protein
VSFTSANGTPVSFTIRAPVTTNTVTIAPSGDTTGLTDWMNLNFISPATGYATIPSGTHVQLQAGNYYLTPPNTWPAPGTGATNTNILFFQPGAGGISDVTFQGAGKDQTNLYFSARQDGTATYGIGMRNSSRIMIRDLSIHWQQPNAIPGVVTTVGGIQRLTITSGLGSYYVPNPAAAPPIRTFIAFNLTGGTYDFRTGSRPGSSTTGANNGFNPNFGTDGLYYYNIAGHYFPENTQAIAWFHQDAGTLNIGETNDVTIANVGVYGGGDGGINDFAASSQSVTGLWVVNSTITKKPNALLRPGEQPWYVSLFGDNGANNINGSTLIESNEFAFIGDDLFSSFSSLSTKRTATVPDTQHFTITQNSQIILRQAGLNNPLDVWQFYDAKNLTPVGQPMHGTWTQTQSGSNWTVNVTLDQPVPGLAPYASGGPKAGPNALFAIQAAWGNPNFVFRNNCLHDSIGRLDMAAARNVLIQNNTFANTWYGPIVLWWTPDTNPNPGLGNITVDSNRLVGINYGATDYDWLGGFNAGIMSGMSSAAIAVAPNIGGLGPPTTGKGYLPATQIPGRVVPNGITAIDITNNFISNTPGLGIMAGAIDDLAVTGNTIVDGNAMAYFPNYNALFCGFMAVGTPIASSATPICPNFVASTQAVTITGSTNVDAVSTPNVCLGTTIPCVYINEPTIVPNGIYGSFFWQPN